jgi:hypothetical protein
MDFKDDVRFVIIALVMCALVPFTLISSFVFTAKFYSMIDSIPCEICGEVK